MRIGRANGTRFGEIWRRCADSPPSPSASTVYSDLRDRLSEKFREFHNLGHIDDCLARFDEVSAHLDDPDAVEIALWFHDAIYEPMRGDNETRSADWARTATLATGATAASADRVHALVMATRHAALPATPDEALLVDVDLAILGAPSARFAEYEAQVRAEYALVPDWLFRGKRRAILLEFLARPRIFATEHFHATLEARARENLQESVAALDG